MKKLLPLCLALAVIAGCFVITAAAEYGESVVVCDTNVGDANGDGKVNLSDVSLTLKHIAKWNGISIDLNRADVLNDGKVILSDVSMMLKHIAKWTSVRMGHNDTREVIKKPTCQENGETLLTCKECGSVSTVYPGKVPCDYRKTVIKEATCGADGTDRYTCTMCGDSYERKVPATKEHIYYGGRCVVCLYKHPSVNGVTDDLKLRAYAKWVKNERGELYPDGIRGFTSSANGYNFEHYYDPASDSMVFVTYRGAENYTLSLRTILVVPIRADNTEYGIITYGMRISDEAPLFLGVSYVDPRNFYGLDKVKFSEVALNETARSDEWFGDMTHSLVSAGLNFFTDIGNELGIIKSSDLGFKGY